jgi:predicted DNA-binding protein with PD1-like motif
MQTKKISGGYFLRIDKGEEVISSIVNFAADNKIPSAVITGIGALTDVTLGYFDQKQKQYLKRTFKDIYEMLSLSGNVSYLDDKPMVHAHVILGRPDYTLIGGHLFSGIVAVTGEIYIKAFEDKFNRRLNPEFDLNLLSF